MTKKAKSAKGAGKRELVDQLSAQHQELAVSLESLTGEVQTIAFANAPVMDEIRRLLEDVLVAQHRTNHLLELALRAGFDDELPRA
jgi:hypothetical protein